MILTAQRYSSMFIVLAILLGFAIVTPALGQSPEVVLFKDDFESGNTSAWRFTRDGKVDATAWKIEREPSGNAVLSSASAHAQASPAIPQNWDDFRLRVRVKLASGAIMIHYRTSGQSRYLIRFAREGINIAKQISDHQLVPSVANANAPNAMGVWYNVEISGYGGNIRVIVDGVQRIDYDDPDPLLKGSINFEALEGTYVYIDDVTVLRGPAPPPTATPTALPGMTWVRTGGPLGGIGYDVRIDPTNLQRLYVTDAWSGAYKSENGGSLWFPINDGITSRTGTSGDAIPVFCLTIDPRNPNILWAGTQAMRGVYKSTNGGVTWGRFESGIPNLRGITFRSFAVDPTNSDIVYTGVEVRSEQKGHMGLERSFGKIFKTTNGGQSWSEVLDAGALVRWIVIDPTDTRILYAATGIFDRDEVRREGVLKSADGGRTWRNINNGITNLTVGGLVMDPRNPKVLYASTGHTGGFEDTPDDLLGSVHKTIDGGETWVEVLHNTSDNPSNNFPVTAIALAPSNPDIVYAATGDGNWDFFRSRDGGKTWQSFRVEPDGGMDEYIPIAVTVDPKDANVVYINSYMGGVFKSIDGGETWHIASQGYTGAQMTGVDLDPRNPSFVYAIGRQGVARSENAGENWIYLNRGTNQGDEGAGISVNPENPQEVLVSDLRYGQIFFSPNAGGFWTKVARASTFHKPDSLHGIVQFARFRGNPKIIYAAGRIAVETFNWNRRTRSIGVLKSTNGGGSWQSFNEGLIADLNINTIAIHPTDPNIVYAGTLNGGVYKTSDGGTQWRAIGGNFATDIRALAIDSTNPSIIYAGTEDQSVFLSTDAGETWKRSGAGMDPSASIHALVIDPTRPNVIWAGDVRSGVYVSPDGGKTWRRVNEGLRTRAVTALAISADGKTLYAATDGEGVFRLDQAQIPQSTLIPTATITPLPATSSPTAPPATRTPTAFLVATATIVPTLVPTAFLVATATIAPPPAPTATPSGGGLCGSVVMLPLAIAGLVLGTRVRQRRM